MRKQLFILVASSFDLGSVKGEVNHGERLIEWLNSKEGGYANPKIEIRRADANDPTSHYGMYTKEAIIEKELILDIPQDMLIRGDEDDEEEDDEEASLECATIRRLIKEMRLGNDSKYAPYVSYLAEQPYGQLPSAWSNEGKELLTRLLEDHTDSPIPPDEPTLWIDHEWVKECNGSSDSFESNAALMLIQCGWDSALIPLYDMMSHRNGDYLNTESNSVHTLSKNVKVRAMRDIEAGEEIYTSYNMCKDCGGRKETYGTSDIFRDYGFIESYPQRWFFEAVSFEISEKDDGEFEVSWLNDGIDLRGLEYLGELNIAMKAVAESTLKNVGTNVPTNELDTILQYYKALTLATSLALDASLEADECENDEKTCDISMKRYVDLTKDTEETDMEVEICDNSHFFEFEDYVDVDAIQSAYQLISTTVRHKDKDTCFDLDDTVQICSSYRPHYHEMVTHHTARFLPDIKRVLWVGGGDSMLLHEILKYPNLEIAVGLELDQHVTRMAFNTFGAQPHWDNDRVEWWYGDACKSLMMLPQNYFGSFDMVLVDLSETVMSFKVTGELDIMQALALLLKPNGIMVKNELYFPKMTEVFRHTTQVHYYDVPVICSQALVLGSPGVNFMLQPLTDHDIDSKNLFVESMNIDEHFSTVHDYKYVADNINNQCKQENETLGRVVPEIQEESPGITFFVEAESANEAFVSQPSKNILDQIVEVLQKKGLTILSTIEPIAESANTVVVAILKEGYVVSKVYPMHKYVAFDISLWSSFEKHKSVKDALVLAVGSSINSSSSYRIVSGGMFGVETWKNDKTKRGPHRTIACDGTVKKINTQTTEDVTDQEAVEIILRESMELVSNDDNLMIVGCGQESEQCDSFSSLVGMENEHKILRISFCPSINDYGENFANNLHSCEKKVLKEIRNFVKGSNGLKIKAIVLDSSMPYQMGQILFKIFSHLKNRFDFLPSDTAVLSVSGFEKVPWRSNFVNRFRKEIHIYEPSFKSDILLKKRDKVFVLSIVSRNEKFVKSLRDLTSRIEERTGFDSEIKDVLGGMLIYTPTYEFSKFYYPSDYDQISPLEQWASQKPLEQQTIFQLEENKKKSGLSTYTIRDALVKVLALSQINSGNSEAQVKAFSDVGDGFVIVAFWSNGRAVLVWDGRKHIDINLSTDADNESLANKFKDSFLTEISSLSVSLQDTQPRGIGRVVSYLKDMKAINTPIWA